MIKHQSDCPQALSQCGEQRLPWAAMLLAGHELPAGQDLLLTVAGILPWWLTAGAFKLTAHSAPGSAVPNSQHLAGCWASQFQLEHRSAPNASAPSVWAAAPGMPLWHAAVAAASRISLISDPRCQLSLRCSLFTLNV